MLLFISHRLPSHFFVVVWSPDDLESLKHTYSNEHSQRRTSAAIHHYTAWKPQCTYMSQVWTKNTNSTPIKQHVNTARCTQPYTRTQTDACTLEDAQTPSFGGLWCGGCTMRMMMKALLYYAACCHYPTLQTEPDRGPSSSTIPAVNIHVIAQQQLSGKIRSVITEVNLSQSLIRSIRVVSIHD